MTATGDRATLDVHPVAALFPMLADDELADMAADIKERGLLQPITLDSEGRILDGRNRYAACQIAGVKPEFVTYEGDDPEGYALAVNLARRNLNKGQMAAIATNPRSVVSTDSGVRLSLVLGVSAERLSHARTVWNHAPDLAEQVAAGLAHLDEAYPEALARKKSAIQREKDLARVAVIDPDMAVLVREKRLNLPDALAALEAREIAAREEASAAERQAQAQAEADRQHATRISDSFRTIIGRIQTLYQTPELQAEVVALYADDLGNAMPAKINVKTIRQASEYLSQIADQWEMHR